MGTPPPLPRTYQPRRNWLERNLKWFIPVLVLVVLAGIGAFVFTLLSLMKSSDAYTGALALVKSSPAVTTAIGTPVKDGLFFTGNIEEGGSSGSADFSVPISGPKGSANVYVNARRSNGEWHYEHVMVCIDNTRQKIELGNTNNIQ